MNVNGMVLLFNRTAKNILHNFTPHEIITCDDRDQPWINISIRRLIQDKNKACKRLKRSNNNSQHFENCQSRQNLLDVSIEASKQRYYSRLSTKLTEPSTSTKTYWSVLMYFYNNKKLPRIPPMFHKNRFVTNFFFCYNSSEILSFLHPKSDKSLSNITFTEKELYKI